MSLSPPPPPPMDPIPPPMTMEPMPPTMPPSLYGDAASSKEPQTTELPYGLSYNPAAATTPVGWTAHMDKESGKMYYSDGFQTSWTLPEKDDVPVRRNCECCGNQSPAGCQGCDDGSCTNEASTGNVAYDFWLSVFQADEPPKIIVHPAYYTTVKCACDDCGTCKGCSKECPIVPCWATMLAGIDNFFRITERGSNFQLEFWGGMTTFLSMCYILVLNGVIIAGPFNSGISVNGVFFATALTAGTVLFSPALLNYTSFHSLTPQ